MILAADSLGVRSLATKVGDFVIDPGAALGPKRYGLPPHPLEQEALNRALERIERALAEARFASVSHYHYDHYLPRGNYEGKVLYLKDWEKGINLSQKKRAREFLDHLKGQDCTVERADGRDFGRVEFSPAVPHGPEGSRLGFVVMAHLPREKLIHASDVQGPQVEATAEWIIEREPDTLVLSGFPTLFIGWKASVRDFERSKELLRRIIPHVKTIVLDHHLVRDLNYRRRMEDIAEFAEEHGTELVTAAGYMGLPENRLEANRKRLWSPRT